MIIAAFFEVFITQTLISPKPEFSLNLINMKLIFNRGKWLTLAGVFNYLFENIDDAFVGKLLTEKSLGVYQIAYKITSLPLTEISLIVNRVTMPVFVNIRHDVKRLKKAYIKSFLVTFSIVFLFGIVIYVFPEQIVRIILGDKWITAVPIIRIMSFFGVVRAVTVSTYPLFLAMKKQFYVSMITLVNIIFMVFSLIILIGPYGMAGAGFSAIIGALGGVPLSIYYIFKVFK